MAVFIFRFFLFFHSIQQQRNEMKPIQTECRPIQSIKANDYECLCHYEWWFLYRCFFLFNVEYAMALFEVKYVA